MSVEQRPPTTSSAVDGQRRPRGRRVLGVVVAAVLGLVALGCSSGSDDAGSDTCADLQQVADDVRAVTEVNLISDGTSALTHAFDQLRSSLDTLAKDADSKLRPTVETFESSVSSISNTLTSLGDRPLSESASQLEHDVQQMTQAFQDLSDTAEQELSGCDIS